MIHQKPSIERTMLFDVPTKYNTPVSTTSYLRPRNEPQEVFAEEGPYRELIEALMRIVSNIARPNIMNAVGEDAKNSSPPSPSTLEGRSQEGVFEFHL